ncbi:collagen, putative, partial [Ixodes scapularis]
GFSGLQGGALTGDEAPAAAEGVGPAPEGEPPEGGGTGGRVRGSRPHPPPGHYQDGAHGGRGAAHSPGSGGAPCQPAPEARDGRGPGWGPSKRLAGTRRGQTPSRGPGALRGVEGGPLGLEGADGPSPEGGGGGQGKGLLRPGRRLQRGGQDGAPPGRKRWQVRRRAAETPGKCPPRGAAGARPPGAVPGGTSPRGAASAAAAAAGTPPRRGTT